MSQWTEEIPDPKDFAAIRLIRVPTAGTITGLITSPNIIGCWTHWDAYRTQPCPGLEPPPNPEPHWQPCRLCKDAQPRRWHAWISLYLEVQSRQIVLQLPTLAATNLRDARAQYGYLRGLVAAFSRQHKRPNSRILVETRPLLRPQTFVPEPVDIKRYMSLIWQVAPTTMHSNGNGQPHADDQA